MRGWRCVCVRHRRLRHWHDQTRGSADDTELSDYAAVHAHFAACAQAKAKGDQG